MENKTFGEYLRKLRKGRQLSQEKLASDVHRKKMTISDIEQGKNYPPQGELLEMIIYAMRLSASEAQDLRFLAAKERNQIPGDVLDYFFSDPSICDALRVAKEKQLSGEDLLSLICRDDSEEYSNV